MENPASTEEETHTEEDATTTPPGNEIHHNQAPHSHFQYSGMMAPYFEGPKMDWTLENALHSRFIRWKIKCENILDCELAILQESAKCKKWSKLSGDAGLGMYISWALPTTEVTLQTIWSKFEDFCKPLSNAVHAWFNLLTTFQQAIEALSSGTMQYRCTFHYVSALQKLLQFSLGTFSGSSWQIMNLLPKQYMKPTQTLHNIQLPKCNRWPRS